LNLTEYFKALVDQLSFSIGLATSVSSGAIVLSPWFKSNLDAQYFILALIVFIFSSVWVFWEVVRWISDAVMRREKSLRIDRVGLHSEILIMQLNFRESRGMRANKETNLEVAAKIQDKYARLNRLGVATPEIDPAASEWDFDQHNRFLTGLTPLLRHSPMKDVKKHARSLLKN
jgi:hypothetical protein